MLGHLSFELIEYEARPKCRSKTTHHKPTLFVVSSRFCSLLDKHLTPSLNKPGI